MVCDMESAGQRKKSEGRRMIYRGVKLPVEKKKKRRKDWLKAVVIAVLAVAVIAAVVIGVQQLGLR